MQEGIYLNRCMMNFWRIHHQTPPSPMLERLLHEEEEHEYSSSISQTSSSVTSTSEYKPVGSSIPIPPEEEFFKEGEFDV